MYRPLGGKEGKLRACRTRAGLSTGHRVLGEDWPRQRAFRGLQALGLVLVVLVSPDRI